MGSFLKVFFASLLALLVFTILAFFFFVSYLGGLAAKEMPKVASQSVLVLDLGQHFKEQMEETPLGVFDPEDNKPGLYDVVRLLTNAATDKKISGIYIKANSNPNGFAASEEIRTVLSEFRNSGKFVIAHGDVISQRAYSVANIADKIYVSPQGFVEWVGYSVDLAFLKGTLEKLEIEPQIFYAGKFKSATEPFRADKMTPENQLQTSVWLNDLYSDLLVKTAETRKMDTGTLRLLAQEGIIQTAKNAVDHLLVDSLKYDDQVKDEIKSRLKIDKYDKINFISINTYYAATGVAWAKGEKIALIYAEGDIIDGKSEQGTIGSETYRNLIRKARLDKSIKAIVLRVNSGGGSAMASENILRELTLAREEKPVVVSFGDVAASGGYYIGCGADSIFALPTTITGSIGVFGIIPNMQSFFKNKLGVTFDGVKTGPYADAMTITRPMNENEKKMIQAEIERIYAQFKQRVADGRKMDTAAVEQIAQGRVWTGMKAKENGLIDRFGGLEDAVQSAARMAKLTEYRLVEYPAVEDIFQKLFGKKEPISYTDKIKEEMGEENYQLYLELKRIKEMTGSVQARMPFQFFIH
ncbi:MAG: signal peptide peptidase SppA [Chitinophagaceae bacterium]|nr:signal peptide peptidase SppA [Chitinophagaceae bacterium]